MAFLNYVRTFFTNYIPDSYYIEIFSNPIIERGNIFYRKKFLNNLSFNKKNIIEINTIFRVIKEINKVKSSANFFILTPDLKEPLNLLQDIIEILSLTKHKLSFFIDIIQWESFINVFNFSKSKGLFTDFYIGIDKDSSQFVKEILNYIDRKLIKIIIFEEDLEKYFKRNYSNLEVIYKKMNLESKNTKRKCCSYINEPVVFNSYGDYLMCLYSKKKIGSILQTDMPFLLKINNANKVKHRYFKGEFIKECSSCNYYKNALKANFKL